MFCPSFYLGSQEKQNYGDMAYICPLSLYYHSTAYKAYLAVYFSDDKLNNILSDNLSLEGSVSYIVNERDAIVATSDQSLSGIYRLDYDTIKDSFMSSNNFIERNILDTKVYAGFYSISNTDWFMVTILPAPPLIHESNHLMLQIALLYAGFLVLALIFANILAHSITGRLSSVIRQMQTVRHGPPTPMESPEAHDEIGDLIDTYNYMTRKMDELMKKQAKSAEDLRIAEFNSLQAQINPHFLYNTMDMINWMALQGQTEEISHAVQSLSRFYKLTLSRKKGISTIARELEHVTIYVQLQNMRYHDSIELITDIPDELSEYQIPKLTLQPVVENSILHGILEKESKSGTIVITGWMENEDIVLLISDDGVGISPEILSTILSGKWKQPVRRYQHCRLQYTPATSDSLWKRLWSYLFQQSRQRERKWKSVSLHTEKSNLQEVYLFMNTQSSVLLYNFNDPDRLRMIRRYLNRQKVKVRIVTTPEFLHPLGYLFELPGFQPCAQFNLGKNFSEEMMVLNNFSSEQMDAFLAFFREEAIPSVSLKAMLTPVTQHWSSIQLHDELTKEHTMMHKK